MRNQMSVLLLILVLAAVICDITIHVRPVRAQSSPTVYIDQIFNAVSVRKPVVIKGNEIVAFSCANEYCYVLSK